MKKEIIVSAKTIEEALDMGCIQLKTKPENITFEVLENPKKGFFGLGASDAKVKISAKIPRSEVAADYVRNIISHMELDAKVNIISESDEEININITGENLGILIGYHGEMLDSLQYLTFLTVNKELDEQEGTESDTKKGGVKIYIDVENYREKRKQTLEALARKMADKALKFKRPITLEPMNSFERRIIHSVIQEIDGVTTYSVGQDGDRKIVVTKEGWKKSDSARPFNSSERPKKTFAEAPKPFRPNLNVPKSATSKPTAQSNNNAIPKKTSNLIYNPPREPKTHVKAKSFEEYTQAEEENK